MVACLPLASYLYHFYTNLDSVDDVCLLVKLLDLLVCAVEAVTTEAADAAFLGLEVNWPKIVLTLNCNKSELSFMAVH